MIERTTNYSLFKHHPGNRPLDPLNVKKIRNSLKTNNMLEFKPILVNDKMEIIDGQHRLEAAKQLSFPVFYTVKGDFKPQDIALLNSAQKQWSSEEFVGFHASQGNQTCLDIQYLMKKHDITFPEMMIFLGIDGGRTRAKIKDGSFTFNKEEKEKEIIDKIGFLRQVIDLVHEKTLGNKKYLTTTTFKRAFISLLNIERFSQIIFINKLQLNLQKFIACSTTQQYINMMIGIYNYRNNEPIEA